MLTESLRRIVSYTAFSGALKARQSPTPVALCTPRDGLIQALSAVDNEVLGYVSKPVNEYGDFGITTDPTNAVLVHANCDGQFFDLPALVRKYIPAF